MSGVRGRLLARAAGLRQTWTGLPPGEPAPDNWSRYTNGRQSRDWGRFRNARKRSRKRQEDRDWRREEGL